MRGKKKEVQHVRILYVEDSLMVAEAVRDALESEGWGVKFCAEGADALREIESATHYDILLLDNELPDVSGLELARRARENSRCRRTPIVMLSGSDCEAEAQRAGVDVFLRKPGDILALADTVARLLNAENKPL
ncbi:MAG: response regulator [Acidobacteria bacterium]|nr:response regulator [Acidobacteriota bacterium]